ncbi:MAG: sodium/glutamate symporter [Eubacteriales bacterium]|nr:sodium/glutamate symporter [Eubacteriales bacterium]
MTFTPWSILQDIGILSILILIGQVMRAKISVFQKLFIPAPLIAGFIGLILGPNVLGFLPLSKYLGTYASVLIVVVFAAMPIGQKVTKTSIANKNVGGMFFNVTGMLLLQYALFGIIGLLFFSNFSSAFGLIVPIGFQGGHGTAAAMGATLETLGWPAATDLGMTSATAGLIGGIIFGVALINWGARKGYTSYVKDPSKISNDLLTGLIPIENQKAGGKVTVSSISLDTLTFHLSLILTASVLGYASVQYLKSIFPAVTVPDFSMALIFGFIIQMIISKTKTDKYVDRFTISRISGVATDILIVCGVASVKISVVMAYLIPLVVLFTLGYIVVITWFRFVAPLCSDSDWFERGMIAFGQATGVLATGILLLRIVDPELRSKGLEDSGTVNLINRPIVIGFQTFMPMLMSQKGNLPYFTSFATIAGLLVLMVFAIKFKWIRKPTTLMALESSQLTNVN